MFIPGDHISWPRFEPQTAWIQSRSANYSTRMHVAVIYMNDIPYLLKLNKYLRPGTVLTVIRGKIFKYCLHQ